MNKLIKNILNKTLILSTLFLSNNVYSNNYKILMDCKKCHIKNNNQSEDLITTQKLIFKQTDFSSLSSGTFNSFKNIEYSSFTLYHSDELYIVFNKQIDNNNKNRLNYYVNNAIKIVNKDNVDLSYKVSIVHSELLSGIVFGSDEVTWCSIVHGRYNGSCRNNSYGIGDWSIYVE